MLIFVVSIHAPRKGCGCKWSATMFQSPCFNPRTPRGVRSFLTAVVPKCAGFNPRTPRGVRLLHMRWFYEGSVSIHAPREGCGIVRSSERFEAAVSIHAPREGCGRKSKQFPAIVISFNPRTPRGVRLQRSWILVISTGFNPRTPRGVRFWTN